MGLGFFGGEGGVGLFLRLELPTLIAGFAGSCFDAFRGKVSEVGIFSGETHESVVALGQVAAGSYFGGWITFGVLRKR